MVRVSLNIVTFNSATDIAACLQSLQSQTYRDFAISPDGRLLGVIAPGKRNLLVFALPPR